MPSPDAFDDAVARAAAALVTLADAGLSPHALTVADRYGYLPSALELLGREVPVSAIERLLTAGDDPDDAVLLLDAGMPVAVLAEMQQLSAGRDVSFACEEILDLHRRDGLPWELAPLVASTGSSMTVVRPLLALGLDWDDVASLCRSGLGAYAHLVRVSPSNTGLFAHLSVPVRRLAARLALSLSASLSVTSALAVALALKDCVYADTFASLLADADGFDPAVHLVRARAIDDDPRLPRTPATGDDVEALAVAAGVPLTQLSTRDWAELQNPVYSREVHVLALDLYDRTREHPHPGSDHRTPLLLPVCYLLAAALVGRDDLAPALDALPAQAPAPTLVSDLTDALLELTGERVPDRDAAHLVNAARGVHVRHASPAGDLGVGR